jgi:predicted secreted acid phosphatase
MLCFCSVLLCLLCIHSYASYGWYLYLLIRCDPFDSPVFKEWITKGMCPANPVILRLFKTLIERGFKVFLLTGRYEETLAKITTDNLHNQGFIGYQRLILR